MSPTCLLASGQGNARHQAHRAHVGVLVELAAELEQRSPQRNVVGHGGWPADGAEIDGVEVLELANQSSGIIWPCCR